MISLDQVLLLEEKVENAVAKIEQLNAENAALRRKCAELTNALSAKTEQFSTFQTDQDKIEAGILKALEKLNTVENAIHTAASMTQAAQPTQQEEHAFTQDLNSSQTSQSKETTETQPQNLNQPTFDIF